MRPEEFDAYREHALALGFLECVAGPLVRSSYRAEQALARNNAGLGAGGLATTWSEAWPTSLGGTTDACVASLATAGTPVALRWLGKVAYEPTWRCHAGAHGQRDRRERRTNSGFSNIRPYSRWA